MTIRKNVISLQLRPHGGCGTDSNLHSTEAPGYGRLGFPIPYTPELVAGRGVAPRRHGL